MPTQLPVLTPYLALIAPYLIPIAIALLVVAVEVPAAVLRWGHRADEANKPSRGMLLDLLPIYFGGAAWLACIAVPGVLMAQFGYYPPGCIFIYALATMAGMAAGLRQLPTPGTIIFATISRRRG